MTGRKNPRRAAKLCNSQINQGFAIIHDPLVLSALATAARGPATRDAGTILGPVDAAQMRRSIR